jgi:hypothetical protein
LVLALALVLAYTGMAQQAALRPIARRFRISSCYLPCQLPFAQTIGLL